MPRSQVLYEVLYSNPQCEWEPFGMMYSDRARAEQELREMKPHYPTAFLARVVFTRVEETPPRRKLQVIK